MIKIEKKNDEIVIKGHTKPDLCASVSCIMYTTINALAKYDEQSINFIDDNILDEINITILKHDNIIDLLINNMFDCFKDLIETDDVKEYINLKIL